MSVTFTSVCTCMRAHANGGALICDGNFSLARSMTRAASLKRSGRFSPRTDFSRSKKRKKKIKSHIKACRFKLTRASFRSCLGLSFNRNSDGRTIRLASRFLDTPNVFGIHCTCDLSNFGGAPLRNLRNISP
ncbi:hypothetical protein PUN28_012619 [Cardiocondyla obscurior]|uniref:Uncharacterized protein n=1 Tax=Cardiocondyla obscurior TaxID=286306 RepID=A0AAW2FDK3_9HYME